MKISRERIVNNKKRCSRFLKGLCINTLTDTNGFLPLTEFNKDNWQDTKLACKCKMCVRKYHNNRYKNNPEYDAIRQKQWRILHPVEYNIRNRQKSWTYNGVKNNDGSLFKWANYLSLLEKSKDKNGIVRCQICFTDNPGKNGWTVDHNHKNGIIRGILCRYCNLLLGDVKDNINILKEAVRYLKKPNLSQP